MLGLRLGGVGIELKSLEFEVEVVVHELTNSMDVDAVELGDEGGGDESVLESKTDVFAGTEDELVEVVEDELEGLWVALVDFDYLADAARVEGLILDVPEVTEDLLYLLLHPIYIPLILYPSI